MISLRRFMIDAFLPALCVTGVIYNFLVALNGDEGVRAHALVREDLAERESDLAELVARREWLERKAALLSRENLDQDMLDESARRVLGYSASGEFVISGRELDTLVSRLRDRQE